MGEMVVCLGCKTVVWAYDHEPQDVRAIANHLQLPCPNCGEVGNFDGWQASDWSQMHAIADREGFAWQPDGECRWFGATSVIKAMREALESLLPLLTTDDMRVVARTLGGTSEAATRYIERANLIDKLAEDARVALARMKGVR